MKHAATAVSAALISALAGSAWGQSFEILESPADPDDFVSIQAVNHDGSIVAGSLPNPDPKFTRNVPYVWSKADGFRVYGHLAPLSSNTNVGLNAVSDDGETLGGGFFIEQGQRPYVYSEPGGFMRLDSISEDLHVTYVADMSSDGTVAVVTDHNLDFNNFGSSAYRWTQETGLQPLGTLGNVGDSSAAFGVSSDGSIVVGSTGVTFHNLDHPMRWTEASGMELLGNDPGHANAVTPSGDVIVGVFSGDLPFRWTDSTGAVELSTLPSGNGEGEASAVSDDGRYIVGWSSSGIFDVDREAVVWTEAEGIRKLSDILQDDFGIDLTGWQLIDAGDISGDGTTIVGDAFDPQGNRRGYIATLPAESDCLADVNNDGMLSPTDFTAWVGAFNANAPECDQNNDGMCTPTDFTAWVGNYNAGC